MCVPTKLIPDQEIIDLASCDLSDIHVVVGRPIKYCLVILAPESTQDPVLDRFNMEVEPGRACWTGMVKVNGP